MPVPSVTKSVKSFVLPASFLTVAPTNEEGDIKFKYFNTLLSSNC